MAQHRIYTTSFASVYPHYVTKAERKNRTNAEVDQIICWLTGYSPSSSVPSWTTRSISRPSSTMPRT